MNSEESRIHTHTHKHNGEISEEAGKVGSGEKNAERNLHTSSGLSSSSWRHHSWETHPSAGAQPDPPQGCKPPPQKVFVLTCTSTCLNPGSGRLGATHCTPARTWQCGAHPSMCAWKFVYVKMCQRGGLERVRMYALGSLVIQWGDHELVADAASPCKGQIFSSCSS